MGYQKRKSPKIKVKRKDDVVEQSPSKISMKKRTSPARNEKTPKTDQPKTKPVKKLQVVEGGNSKYRRAKKNTLITAVSVILVILTVVVLDVLTPTGIVEWSQNGFATWGSGGGLPVSVSGDSANGLYVRGSSIFVMTDSHVHSYNSSGKQITAIQHGYSSPVLECSAARTLIYDRGGFSLRIDALYTNFTDIQLNDAIITADICDKGYVAVATASNDYATVVTVYDRSFKSIFRWSSPNSQVSSVELSENGKYLAVATVDAKNGDYCSTVNIFNIAKGNKVVQKEYLGTMFVNSVAAKKHVTFSGIDSVITLAWDGTSEMKGEYYGLELFDSADEDNMVVAFHPGGDERRFTVALLDSSGNEKASFEVDGEISKITADDDYIYCYYNGTVSRYSHNGEIDKTINTGYEYVHLAPHKGKLAVISDMKLNKYE